MGEIGAEKEKLELELMFIYENIVSKKIGKHFLGFIRVAYNMSRSINPVYLEHKTHGPFEKGYEEGLKLRESFRVLKVNDTYVRISKN